MTPSGPAWLRWLGAERGALLWMPGLFLAAALMLFAILQASAERTFFNHTRDLRVALGPVDRRAASAEAAARFTAALRQGLAERRELTLLADDEVQRRVGALLGAPLPEDPRRWMQATRSLNVSVYVTATLREAAAGLQASVALWRVGEEEAFARFAAVDEPPASLGRALADSVGHALFAPRKARHALR